MIGHEHKFVFLKNDSWWSEYGYRGTKFVSIDYFFCEGCLEQKEIKKEHTCNQGNFHERPDWTKSIQNKIHNDE
jgi:hypothetical protein